MNGIPPMMNKNEREAFMASQIHDEDMYYSEDEEMMVEDDDENGNNSLLFAVCQGREDIVRTMADQVSSTPKYSNFSLLISSILAKSSFQNSNSIKGSFLDHQNCNGETAIFWASSLGFDNIVELLLENGANPNITNLDGTSPLHIASANGHLNIVRTLVQNGAFVNIQDEENDSPIHYAVRENKPAIIATLVREFKAKSDLKNVDGETPLELATCLDESNPGEYRDILQILSNQIAINNNHHMGKTHTAMNQTSDLETKHFGINSNAHIYHSLQATY